MKNPFELEGSWYKANLHTHTTISDGDSSVDDRIRQYRERGYSVLAITDHAATNDITGLSTEDFLVLGGMETHPACGNEGDMYHFVCLNVPIGLELPDDMDANTRIARVRDAGGEVIYGHPYWCGHNISHLLCVQGYIGIEVYNATCTKAGKGISSVHWDDLLDAGRALPAIAVDDTHGGRDIFMGWTMIKSPELTVQAIMNALRTGCYYSSTGPTIEHIGIADGRLEVRCSPVCEVHFIGRKASGTSFYSDEGEDMTEASLQLGNYLGFVRVEVVDRRGRRAWSNPFYPGPEGWGE